MAQPLDPGRAAPISPAVPSLLGGRPLHTLVGPLLLCCHFLLLLMDSGGFTKKKVPTVMLSSEGHCPDAVGNVLCDPVCQSSPEVAALGPPHLYQGLADPGLLEQEDVICGVVELFHTVPGCLKHF